MSPATAPTLEQSPVRPTTANKIGGANMSKLDQVKNLIDFLKKGRERITLIVSAFEGVTNALIGAMDELTGKNYQKEDIDRAFSKVTKLHEWVISKFFPDANGEAVRADYQKEYEELRQALLRHQEGGNNNLMPVEGSYQIRDQVIGFGERMGGMLLNKYLGQEGYESHFIDHVEYDGNRDTPLSYSNLHKGIQKGIQNGLERDKNEIIKEGREKMIRILGGHIGNTPRGMVLHIGRSYSDTTAVDTTLALQDQGEEVSATRFWKAVDGVMTTNPNDLSTKQKAVHHSDVSLEEALEMAAAGSQLMQVDALALAYEEGITLEAKNIEAPDRQGTTFTTTRIETGHVFKTIISNAYADTITVALPQMAAKSGFGAAITDILNRHGISFDSCFTESTSMSFSVPIPKDEADREVYRNEKLRPAIDEIKKMTVNGESYNGSIKTQWSKNAKAIISIVGHEMGGEGGILGEIDSIFGAFGINTKSVTHGENKNRITFVIDKTDRQRAIQLLHAIFVDNDEAIIEEFERLRAPRSTGFRGSYIKKVA